MNIDIDIIEIITILKSRKRAPSEKWFITRYPGFLDYLNSWSNINIDINIDYKEKLYLFINGVNKRGICLCGGYTKFVSSIVGYRKYCSPKCVMCDKETVDKIRKTCIKKYNVDNVSKSIGIKNKKKKTSLDNYGVEYNSQRIEMKELLSEQMLEKTHIMNEKQRETRDKYIRDKFKAIESDIEFIKYDKEHKVYICLCPKGHEFSICKNMLNDRIKYGNRICTICNKINNESDAQNQLFEYISSLVSNAKSNARVLNCKEIGFEYNGLYWHSNKYKNKNYHLNKTNKCLEMGISLIHIYEDDWLFKRDIVNSMILSTLNKSEYIIESSVCTIKEIDEDDELIKEFLDKNHIYGFIDSDIRIGLFCIDRLVSIMVFKKLGDTYTYELLRFANSLNTDVIGGESKLFNYFINNCIYESIICIVDRSMYYNNLHENLGFNIESILKPSYYYIKNNRRFNESILVDGREAYKIYNSGYFIYRFSEGDK